MRSLVSILCAIALMAPGAEALSPEKRITQYLHESWGVRDGAPTGTVTALAQTPDGYLWVGTSTEGLLRFNGVEFHRVTELDEAFGKWTTPIDALLVTRDGVLWVGAGWGLARREGEGWRVLTSSQNYDRRVNALSEADDGTVWITFQYRGPGWVEGDEVQTVFPGSAWGPTVLDDLGNLWLTPAGLGLLRTTPERLATLTGMAYGEMTVEEFLQRLEPDLTRFGQAEGLAHLGIQSITRDREGSLWVATAGGLNVIRGGRIESRLTSAQGLSVDSSLCALQDRDGNLWVGTANGGLNRRTPSGFEALGEGSGLTSLRVTALLEDREGSLWVGTEKGLNRLKEGAFTPLGLPEGLPNSRTLSVLEDRDGSLWTATDGGGLVQMTGERVRVFTTADGLGSNFCGPLHEARDGSLWIGHDLGVSRLRRGVFTSFQGGELSRRQVAGLAEDERGMILSVWNLGLRRLIGNELRPYRPAGSSSVDMLVGGKGEVFSTLRARDGSAWLAHPVGVTVVRDGHARNVYDAATSYQVHEDADRDGVMWVATATAGLVRIIGDQVTEYTVEDGLVVNDIKNLIEDDQGVFWLSSPRGVLRIEKSQFEELSAGKRERLAPQVFGAANGMRSPDASYGSQPNACLGRDGRLWFTTVDGLVSLRPARLGRNTLPPPVHIEAVTIDGEEQPYGNGSGLRVAARARAMGIKYAGLSLLAPERMRFKHRLDGFDEDWVDVGSQRAAQYTGLTPGRYTFRVMASNNDGVWSTGEATLSFDWAPRWYQTWLARLFFLVALSAIITGGYRWRVAALRQRERELSEKVEERTGELSREIAEHKLTEDKLAGSNTELLENQQALERENEQRRQAEEAAGRERDLLHALMDNIPDLIYFKDRESRFTRINKAHATAFGLVSVDEAAGKTDADFFAEEFAAATRRDEQALMESGDPMLGKVEREPHGDRWFLATKVPIRDASGEVSGLVGISKDISERRQAEEKLRLDMEAFQEVTRGVREGDLTLRGQESEETLGEIARAVNSMLESFCHILAEVRDAAFSVSTASSEILAASTQIAKGARHGRDQVHSTSSAVEEMATSMSQVAKHAGHSAEASQQVLDHLRESDRAVDATAQGMTRIDAAVSTTAEKMRALGERSGEIFEIIDLIEDLASRSELLSMNAAIEAAHAGDLGRGFGVVADEIRHLAERSNDATRSVTKIVKGMAEETQAALAAMQNSTREVKQGLELSEQARAGLQEISTLVQQAADLAVQISTAAGEQNNATETVSKAMQAIASITEESTAGSNETTRAVQDLVSLSEQLNTAISRFTIDRPQATETTSRVEVPLSTFDRMAALCERLDQAIQGMPGGASAAAPSDPRPGGAERVTEVGTLARDLGEALAELKKESGESS